MVVSRRHLPFTVRVGVRRLAWRLLAGVLQGLVLTPSHHRALGGRVYASTICVVFWVASLALVLAWLWTLTRASVVVGH